MPVGEVPIVVGEAGRAAETVPTFPVGLWQRPDTVIDGGRAGDLEVRAISTRGLAGRFAGKPRQDDYGLGVSDDGEWLVACVSDGIGSQPLSHRAAEVIVRRTVLATIEQLRSASRGDVDWKAVFGMAAAAVLARGMQVLRRDDGLPPEPAEVAGQMSATLLVAVLPTRSVGSECVVRLARVGDSSAWSLTTAGRWIRHSGGKDGVETDVVALPALPIDGPDVIAVSLRPGDRLFLMSDGMGDPLGAGVGEVADFLRTSWESAPSTLAFADQASFVRKSYTDDRTVIGIWPAQEGGRP
jgi:serine/threonine protein phosphatase PrpC